MPLSRKRKKKIGSKEKNRRKLASTLALHGAGTDEHLTRCSGKDADAMRTDHRCPGLFRPCEQVCLLCRDNKSAHQRTNGGKPFAPKPTLREPKLIREDDYFDFVYGNYRD